jgi:SAM-dependent methyltransferase
MPSAETSVPEYDRFSEIYTIWTDTAAATRANLAFYVDAYLEAEGPVVELGVGDGRIAVEAAARGRAVTGLDLSPVMLDRCRRRAAAADVLDRLTLIQGDFRSFQLDVPAGLIALPYHSLGHLVTLDEKRDALARVYAQLCPGGRFIFDDFLMTPALIAHMRRVQLRATYKSAAGLDTFLWVTSLVDEGAQRITVVTWEDEADAEGLQVRRQYRRLSLSWVDPSQARALLSDAGFLIEACFGDFARTPFDQETATEQIWMARKPG